MGFITRRAFLGTMSAIPFAEYFPALTAKTGMRMRHEARSPEGQAMLKVYAHAVAAMRSTKEGDPLGWLFQWYTHAVRPDRAKIAEINRIYTSSSDPHKALANEAWDTCQPHFDPNSEPYFLPWHRMFVYFFERIVAKAAKDDSFALPYWNYSVSGPTHGVIPQQFRDPKDPAFAALYVAKRNAPSAGDPNTPDVNRGDPIDKVDPGALDLGVLGECEYGPSGAAPGFNKGLDDGLHGFVHVDIGNVQNMGSIPWAADDPIFWMHHCNVDRLWASWNSGGRKNPSDPTFLTQQFVFADENGNRVAPKVGEFLDIAALGYSYSDLEPIPKCAPPKFGLAPQTPTTLAANNVELALTNSPVHVKLQTPAGLVPFGAEIKTLPADQRLFLRLKNLRANIQPGVLYHVYLNLPSGAGLDSVESHRAGLLSFFNFTQMGRHPMDSNNRQRFVSFDVTQVTRELEAKGLLKEGPTLTIAPARQPATEAKVLVGEIDLVQQEE